MRRWVIPLALLFAAHPTKAVAQYRTPAGVVAAPVREHDLQSLADRAPSNAAARRPPSLARHLLVGAFYGFAISSAASVAAITWGGCLCDFTGFVPFVAISTGIGATTGALVYMWRRSH
jgi:hypothetical protein